MSRNNLKSFVAAAFIIPVLCCLLAVGAFVSVATSVTREEEKERRRLSQSIEEQTAAKQALTEELSDLEKRLRQLEEAREDASETRKAKADLDDLESLASDLEKRLLALRQQVATAEAAIRTLHALRSDVAQLSAAMKELHLKLRIARLREKQLRSELDAAVKKEAERQRTFAVTALSGRGSRRKAIFAECGTGGITIQPAKVQLSSNIGTRDQKTFLSLAKRTGYVVFLIRPDGFEAFHRYRSLIASENRLLRDPIETGYEPVDADWVLAYPEKGDQAHGKSNRP